MLLIVRETFAEMRFLFPPLLPTKKVDHTCIRFRNLANEDRLFGLAWIFAAPGLIGEGSGCHDWLSVRGTFETKLATILGQEIERLLLPPAQKASRQNGRNDSILFTVNKSIVYRFMAHAVFDFVSKVGVPEEECRR